MKIGVVLFSCHNAKAGEQVLGVIDIPKLTIMTNDEQEKYIETEFQRMKKNFLATLSDHSGLDIYYRIYNEGVYGQNTIYPSNSTLSDTSTLTDIGERR